MRRCDLVVAAGLWAAACVAQSPNPADAGKLQFGIVITDPNGGAIRDVSGKDLTIEIQKTTQPGQVQPISPVAAIVDPAPGEFTNRNSAATGRGLVMLVLDTIHTRWLDEKDLRPVIAKYLASCASHNLPVFLLVMDPRGVLHTVHDYTTSSTTLTAALNRADAVVHGRPPGDATPEVTAETTRLVDFLKGAIANYAVAAAPLRASPEPVLDMFRTLAAATAGISGRKALVWIANITPFEVEEKTGLVVGTTTMVNGFGVTGHEYQNHQMLTPDELKVLRPFWKSCLTALLRTEVALYPLATRGQADTPVDTQTLHAMHVLAAMTGGREIAPMDPLPSLAGLSDQNLAAYDVVASDAKQSCKSDWCDLRVAVNRPGVRVMVPTGFFREAGAWQQAEVLSAGLSSPIDFTGVPFIVRWTTTDSPTPNKTEAQAPKKKVTFVVTFPPEADLPPPTGHELNLQIFVRATKLGSSDPQNANFNAAGLLSPDQARQAHQQGFALNNVVELPPGDYTVKFLVHDKLTGRLGSITVPLKVS
jgi:VWFA-related protein